MGRGGGNAQGVGRVRAPDGAPAVLRSISKAREDGEIRRRGGELARLDEETDEPPAADPRP